MPSPLENLKQNLQPYRDRLIEHPLYASIDSLAGLHAFMQQHVFAVWDFMSLLKSLQRRISVIDIPWIPPQNPEACRLINEIVLGEECDDDGEGGYASHFELYRRAMRRSGCPTEHIDDFLEALHLGSPVTQALLAADVPAGAGAFVESTFFVIEHGDPVAIASSFTFGREDLLPDVFRQIVQRIDREADANLAPFLYYLDRHIELDGERHGPMADRLIESLCGDDPDAWRRAEEAARDSLMCRLDLWNAMGKDVASVTAS